MSYTSQNPYGGPVNMPEQRGPDINSAGLPARQLAQGLAEVSGQWASFWAQAQQAQNVATASKHSADAQMELGDMIRGFDSDPDPAGAADRFKQRAAEWRTQKLEGLDPGVQRVLDGQLQRLVPAAYNQVAGRAAERTRTNLRAGFTDTLGTFAQGLAAAPDEPTTQAQLQGIKASISGNVAAGIIPQADATQYFSRAVAQAITIKSATDPIAAQQMLEQHKAEMDAGTVATLTTSLRGPLERTRAEGAATAVMGARGTAGSIHDAILMQESGGRDGLVSIDGARGRYQIMPATFAQYARPGENIDVRADNEAVGRRIIDDLSAKAGGDPARIAVGYFSGPGNIAPAGSPTPWKEDRRDGNGMSVSRYVAQVMNRLTPAGAERNDAQKATLLADVRDRLKDEPLHVQLQGQSLVAQMLNNEQAGQEQARAVLSRELQDLSASYTAGNTGAAIPENRIRQMLPPDQAQRTIDTLTLDRTAGDAYRAVQFASPADEMTMRAELAGNPADTRLAAERQQAVAKFDQAVSAKRRALADDPANVALQSPEVRALAQSNAPLPELVAASLAAQQRMGVPAWKQRVLNDGQVLELANKLRTTGPEKADMAATLAAMQQQFGPELWSRAYGEMVQHGKIGWEWQAIGAMSAPTQAEGRALLQRALVFQAEKGGPEAMKKLVPPDVLKGFDGEVDTALEPLREATRHHPGGDSLFSTMKQAVGTLALYHAWRGMKASEAATRAYQDVIGARWDTAGDDGSGWFGRTPTMLVPKGRGGEIETSLDLVRGRLTPADLQPLPDPSNPGATPAQLADATLAAARRGFWVNNADASGAVLKGRTPGGSVVDLMRADGSRIEVRFDALPQMDRAARDAAELEQGRAAARDQLQRMRATPAGQSPRGATR